MAFAGSGPETVRDVVMLLWLAHRVRRHLARRRLRRSQATAPAMRNQLDVDIECPVRVAR